MSKPVWKKALRILLLLALATAATTTRPAEASHCDLGDPWFFCQCARAEAQQCWSDYVACGGFMVPGCWETYSECRLESGVDQCE